MYVSVSLHFFLNFLICHSIKNKKNEQICHGIKKRNHTTAVTEGQLDSNDPMRYNATIMANVFPTFKVNQQAQL